MNTLHMSSEWRHLGNLHGHIANAIHLRNLMMVMIYDGTTTRFDFYYPESLSVCDDARYSEAC